MPPFTNIVLEIVHLSTEISVLFFQFFAMQLQHLVFTVFYTLKLINTEQTLSFHIVYLYILFI